MRTKELKEARRLLQNGRYAEAEEALTAILADAKKEPARLTPERKLAIVLGLADCQASQGEYAKAIERLKAAEAEEPKNADLPARLADLYLTRGDWEAAEAAMRRAEKLDPDHLLARWVEARLLRAPGRARQGGRRLEVVRRPLQRQAAGDRARTPMRCSWSARPPSATTAPARGARS